MSSLERFARKAGAPPGAPGPAPNVPGAARTASETRLTRAIGALENAGGGGPAWLWLLLGWILARNLLEGVLERPHALGFDWREDVSAAMVFLHYPLFYLLVFAAVSLWLHWVGRRPIPAVARAVSHAFGLLLVAPVLDAAISGGQGYDLKYLLGFGSTLWRFWNPGASLTEVSPGQRIEIALGCLLGGLYVLGARRTRRAPLLALAAAAGVFLLTALAGSWPALFARWTSPSGSAGEAYDLVFRGPGLIASESRRHAVVVALPLLALLPLLAARAGPARFRALLSRLPWTRLVYYAGLVPAGVVLAWALYRDFLPLRGPLGLYGPTDLAAVAVLTAAMLSAVLAAIAWNDLFDLEADRINDPRRPLPDGLLGAAGTAALARAFAASAALLALCVSYPAFLLTLAALFLAWAYSAPPLRLKRVPLLATGVLGLLSLLSLLTGFSLLAQENAPLVFPSRLAVSLVLGVTLGFTAKDLKDREGDRATGVVTVATLFRPERARVVAAALVAAGYLASPLLLPLGWPMAVLAIAFALAGALATLRLSRPDSVLLVAFCVFAAGLLSLVARDPEALRGRAARRLIEGHAALLRGDGGAVTPESHALPAVGPLADRGTWLLARNEDLSVARSAAAALVARHPLDPRPRQRRIEIEFAAGNPQGARRLAEEGVGLGLRPGWFLRQSAAAAVTAAETARGLDATRAREELRRTETARRIRGASLLLARPAPAFVTAGDRWRLLDHPEAARAAYARAARLDPGDADAWASLAESHHAAGELPAAVEAFRCAANLRPDDAWIRNNFGVALRDAGRSVEARAQFEEARRLSPKMFEPLYNLAILAEREGRTEEARALARSAWVERPGFSPAEELARRLGATLPAVGPRTESDRETLEPERRRAEADSSSKARPRSEEANERRLDRIEPDSMRER